MTHRVRVPILNAYNLSGNAVMHVIRCEFIKIPERVFQSIFARPDARCEFIAVEIFEARAISFVEGVGLVVHVFDI